MLGALITSALMALSGGAAKKSMYCTANPDQIGFHVSAPSLSGTITRLDFSWFNLEQDGTSPVFFTAKICNGSEDTLRLRMIVAILVTPTDPALASQCGTSGCWAEEQITKPLAVAPHSSKFISSKDLYSSDYEPGGYDPANAPFRKLLTKLGRLPPSNIEMFFGLTCLENTVSNRVRGLTMAQLGEVVAYNHIAPQTFSAEYRPFDGVSLLQPGAAEGFPEIYNQSPVFTFQSALSDSRYNYGADKRFQLQLWKLARGEVQAQCLSRRPDESLDLDEPQLIYPGSWAPLQAGERYVWRVQARDRGPVTAWIASEPYGFQVASLESRTADPAWLSSAEGLTAEQLRLLRILARILGTRAGVLEQAVREGKVDVSSLNLDGKPLTVDALETMAKDFEAGKNSVIDAGTP